MLSVAERGRRRRCAAASAGERLLDHAEPLIGVDEGAGRGQDPDMLGDGPAASCGSDKRAGPSVGGRDLGHHAARALNQHFARAGLAPVAAVGGSGTAGGRRPRARSHGPARGSRSPHLEAGLVVMRRAEPAPRRGDDALGAVHLTGVHSPGLIGGSALPERNTIDTNPHSSRRPQTREQWLRKCDVHARLVQRPQSAPKLVRASPQLGRRPESSN